MASSPGRTSEPRAVTGVGTTTGSTALTFSANAMQVSDIGRTIVGTGIPAGATLVARPTTTTGTLSANASATGSVTATLGGGAAAASGLGFTGWSPETDAEAAVYPIPAGAGATAPSVLADAVTPIAQRNR